MTDDKPQAVASNALFDRCTETKRMKDGSLRIFCKRGLWGVYGTDPARVWSEAYNYFQQYLKDGEYSNLLSNT